MIIVDSAKLPIPPQQQWLIEGGHCGVCQAVQHIPQLLEQSGLEHMLLIAADSYLEASVLDWLQHHHRLKTSTQSNGLIPGEIGVCTLLSRTTPFPVMATLHSANVQTENNDDYRQAKRQGSALSAAITQSLANWIHPSFHGQMISDMNGENWRSMELASAIVRVGPQQLPNQDAIQVPAESFGETGVASGLLSIIIATQAIWYQCDPIPHYLILCSNENRYSGCLIVSK